MPQYVPAQDASALQRVMCLAMDVEIQKYDALHIDAIHVLLNFINLCGSRNSKEKKHLAYREMVFSVLGVWRTMKWLWYDLCAVNLGFYHRLLRVSL
jgi:hypothetical protein